MLIETAQYRHKNLPSRPTEQNTEPRNNFVHLQSPDVPPRYREYTVRKEMSLQTMVLETEMLVAPGVSTRVGGASPGHSPWRGLAGCSWMLRPRPPSSFWVFSGSWVWPWAWTAADHLSILMLQWCWKGQVENKSFEMTIPVFLNFYGQFKEVAAISETVWKLIIWLINCYHRSKITDFTFCNKAA